jgi:hypothetical protein
LVLVHFITKSESQECLNPSFKFHTKENNIYQFSALNIHKKPVSLSKYKNKVLLIVNVASA